MIESEDEKGKVAEVVDLDPCFSHAVFASLTHNQTPAILYLIERTSIAKCNVCCVDGTCMPSDVMRRSGRHSCLGDGSA